MHGLVVWTICNDWGILRVYTCGEETVCFLVFAYLLSSCFFTCLQLYWIGPFACFAALFVCCFFTSYLTIGMVLVSRV